MKPGKSKDTVVITRAELETYSTEARRVQFVLLTQMNLARIELIQLRDAAQQAGMADAAHAFNIAVNTISEQYETARVRTFNTLEAHND